MTILKFPKPKPTRGRSKKKPKPSAPPAQVYLFAAANNVRMVRNIAKEMIAATKRASGYPMDVAEAVLIAHLECDWTRLERFGVAESEMEADVRAFAVAAWREYVKHTDTDREEPGAA